MYNFSADKQKGPQVVRLTIRVGEQPKYRLNDSATTQSEIADLRKHYNIQVSFMFQNLQY